MQYNAFKVRNVMMWIAVQLDLVALRDLWPVLYLAERNYLAKTGEPLSGDMYVAMLNGPVPLRTYTDLRLHSGQWSKPGKQCQVDNLLKGMATKAGEKPLTASFLKAERECLKWALDEAKRLGNLGLRQAVCGRAWQRAGPDGELDPIEVALEGGADAATLDYILQWRDGAG